MLFLCTQGQAEYENIVENSNKKKTIGNENLGSKQVPGEEEAVFFPTVRESQAAKAELQVTLQRSFYLTLPCSQCGKSAAACRIPRSR